MELKRIARPALNSNPNRNLFSGNWFFDFQIEGRNR
jgi:hypothetical protein